MGKENLELKSKIAEITKDLEKLVKKEGLVAVFDELIIASNFINIAKPKHWVHYLLNPDKIDLMDSPEAFEMLKSTIRINPGWLNSQCDLELKLLILNEISGIMAPKFCASCGNSTWNIVCMDSKLADVICKECGLKNGKSLPIMDREF